MTRIDEALALASETGEHWSDAFLHRIRGEILRKRDPANPAPTEDALLTAIAIAQQQKARFELRAALGLARLYSSTSHSADAHAVLASCAQGVFADPGISRDRRSANASRRARVMSQSNERTTCGLAQNRRSNVRSVVCN
jgi:hypothetical protein